MNRERQKSLNDLIDLVDNGTELATHPNSSDETRMAVGVSFLGLIAVELGVLARATQDIAEEMEKTE